MHPWERNWVSSNLMKGESVLCWIFEVLKCMCSDCLGWQRRNLMRWLVSMDCFECGFERDLYLHLNLKCFWTQWLFFKYLKVWKSKELTICHTSIYPSSSSTTFLFNIINLNIQIHSHTSIDSTKPFESRSDDNNEHKKLSIAIERRNKQKYFWHKFELHLMRFSTAHR